MAKKNKFTSAEIEAQNLQRIEAYVAAGNLIYNDFLEELANIASGLPFGLNSKKVFTFDDFPSIKAKIAKLLDKTTLRAVNSLDAGISDGFLRANAKNDALVDAVFNGTGISKRKLARYYNRNLEATLTRTTKSQLSPRVYKITKQFLRIAEAGIDVGMAKGKSASMLASEIKKAVKEPEFTFRRVRNAKGKLEWSKAAKKYAAENPPGVGVYLNPQKNYERLTRTEINAGYRTSDHNRVQSMDFVVGIKINLSNNPNHCPLCIKLAGFYPKDFLFRGNHPQCRCYKTTVLKTREEMDRDNELILQGKEPSDKSSNTVYQLPKGMKDWLKENSERIKNMEKRDAVPYFLKDNFKPGNYTPKGRIPGSVVGGLPK